MSNRSNSDLAIGLTVLALIVGGLAIFNATKFLGVDFTTTMKFIAYAAVVTAAWVAYLWQSEISTGWAIPFFPSMYIWSFKPILDSWAAGPEFLGSEPEHWYGIWYWQTCLVLAPWGVYLLYKWWAQR